MKTKTFLLGLSALLLGSISILSCSDDDKEIVSGGKTTPKLGAVVVTETSITHKAATVTAELIDWGGEQNPILREFVGPLPLILQWSNKLK